MSECRACGADLVAVPLWTTGKRIVAWSIVEASDYQIVAQHFWHLKSGYASASINGRTTGMHRLLVDAEIVDHIDGDKLNNRRSNLRPATLSQNQQNRRKRAPASSPYKGVAKRPYPPGSFTAYISLQGKRINLGYFWSEVAAAKAYDNAAKELFGEFALLNFPSGDYPVDDDGEERRRKFIERLRPSEPARSCILCGSAFTPSSKRGNARVQKYCSRRCRVVIDNARRRERYNRGFLTIKLGFPEEKGGGE